MTSLLDTAHEAARGLRPDATHAEVAAVLAKFQAQWPNPEACAPGTIAWLLAVFLPQWLERVQIDASEVAKRGADEWAALGLVGSHGVNYVDLEVEDFDQVRELIHDLVHALPCPTPEPEVHL